MAPPPRFLPTAGRFQLDRARPPTGIWTGAGSDPGPRHHGICQGTWASATAWPWLLIRLGMVPRQPAVPIRPSGISTGNFGTSTHAQT